MYVCKSTFMNLRSARASPTTEVLTSSLLSVTIRVIFSVSGETSSGKSSLLNLLLGKEILPHRLLSCTSVICKLRYGPKLHARVVKDDDTVKDVPLDPDANPMQQLSRYIFKEDQRDDKLPYKSVEIGLPLDILKVIFYFPS